jgi:hypothetical protein
MSIIYTELLASGTVTATTDGVQVALPDGTPDLATIAIVLQPGRSGAVTMRQVAGGPAQVIPADSSGLPIQIGPVRKQGAPLLWSGSSVSVTYTIWRV